MMLADEIAVNVTSDSKIGERISTLCRKLKEVNEIADKLAEDGVVVRVVPPMYAFAGGAVNIENKTPDKIEIFITMPKK